MYRTRAESFKRIKFKHNDEVQTWKSFEDSVFLKGKSVFVAERHL